jgi:hypothetical protein
LSCFTKKSVPSLKSLRGAPYQYAVLHVAVLQLPPAVIHSPLRSTSQAQMAFFGLARSTVHGLLRHQVQGVPAAHFNVRLPCANYLSAKWEYTVRMPLPSVLGLTVSHATVAKFGPSSTAVQNCTAPMVRSAYHEAPAALTRSSRLMNSGEPSKSAGRRERRANARIPYMPVMRSLFGGFQRLRARKFYAVMRSPQPEKTTARAFGVC